MPVRGNRFTVVFMTGALLIGGAWTIGPYVFAGRDHDASIDSREVRAAATEACTAMRQAIEVGTPATEAAAAMVAELRRLDPAVLAGDVPSERWLDDWDQLVTAARMHQPVPRVDGARITRRMDDLVKDLRPCKVPEDLLPGRGVVPLDD